MSIKVFVDSESVELESEGVFEGKPYVTAPGLRRKFDVEGQKVYVLEPNQAKTPEHYTPEGSWLQVSDSALVFLKEGLNLTFIPYAHMGDGVLT
jgi:hypothetical protein